MRKRLLETQRFSNSEFQTDWWKLYERLQFDLCTLQDPRNKAKSKNWHLVRMEGRDVLCILWSGKSQAANEAVYIKARTTTENDYQFEETRYLSRKDLLNHRQ